MAIPLRVAVGLIACAVVACHGESVDTGVQQDAAPETSASPDIGVTDASDANTSGPEVLTNPDFELGCAGWDGNSGTLEESPIARSGKISCRVCSSAGTYAFSIVQKPTVALEVGAKYIGEAWLRADDGDAAVAPDPHAIIVLTDDAEKEIAVAEGGTLPIDKTWKRATVAITVKAGATQLEFSVSSHGGGACFLIDDASLRKLP